MGKKIKIHKAVMYPNAFGGVKTTTLCRRSRVTDDGMNSTDDDNEVTCAFCRKILDEATDTKEKNLWDSII